MSILKPMRAINQILQQVFKPALPDLQIVSTKHLSKGSLKPPKVEGKLRLYSMLFCPFVQRTRFILRSKRVPHDIVNVNLRNKPDWLWEINKEGGKSANFGHRLGNNYWRINDFLDVTYPDPPMYPTDRNLAECDRLLMKNCFRNLIHYFFDVAWNPEDNRTLTQHLTNIKPQLDEMEKELEKRGGKFFGGENPMMADFCIWPWAERLEAALLLFSEEVPLPDGAYPHLQAWYKSMRALKVVQDEEISTERHFKLICKYRKQERDIDYDNI